MRRTTPIGLVIGLAAAVVLFSAGPASAHEERTVGKYSMAVGFGDEPAYAGQKNSVQMFLNEKATGKLVVDLGPTLNVEIIYGSRTFPAMTMEPNFEVGEFGTPGEYDAFFFPTRPGDYTFHLTGTIEGQSIDEKFTSSPTTFSSVQDPQASEFPAMDPTTGQLNDRLDREIPRIEGELADQRSSLQDKVDFAKLLGLSAVIVGGVGLLVGVTALVLRRRS